MKMTVDGTLEGTPEELARYQQVIAPGPVKPTVAEKPKQMQLPLTPNKTLVLGAIYYDVVQTMREYGEPMKAPAIATLMGVTGTAVSGRLVVLKEVLKEQGLVEQYPNHRIWRLTAKALSHNIIAQGV